MSVNPNPRELFGPQPLIDLLIKIVRHCIVGETDGRVTASLTDQPDVFDQKQLVRADTKTADFRFTNVTQVKQLGPGRRRESQLRSRYRTRLLFSHFVHRRKRTFLHLESNQHTDVDRIGYSV